MCHVLWRSVLYWVFVSPFFSFSFSRFYFLQPLWEEEGFMLSEKRKRVSEVSKCDAKDIVGILIRKIVSTRLAVWIMRKNER